ncbi:fibrinogen C domain-containing protein 1-like [Branchiostoma floridae]|uniref:Fibrinogen C domain-containing protein 1-like n=2 Tax=Branchiostoma floridae TaxID=7739 RepID=A0A9J7LL70_BRAFL|nr:fibrinogen C domain-containing protein 1-like [Branchiostoma floridae]
MAVLTTVVLVLLHQLSRSAAQHGSEGAGVWPESEIGEHVTLTGSCLAYGELLQYLTRQDKLESELEALKNETQKCCGGTHQASAFQQQQAMVEELEATVGDQANTMLQLEDTVNSQANTIRQMQTLLSQLSDRLSGPRDCMELLTTGHDTSGVYTIYPEGDGKSAVHVYCDMDTDGGGWTLFQKRQDGSMNFYRDWQAYKTGFGDLRGEFWLGNDHLHRLTAQDVYELRVDLEDFEGNTAYAKYNIFRVEDEVHKYRLTVDGYNGTAGYASIMEGFGKESRGGGRTGNDRPDVLAGVIGELLMAVQQLSDRVGALEARDSDIAGLGNQIDGIERAIKAILLGITADMETRMEAVEQVVWGAFDEVERLNYEVEQLQPGQGAGDEEC